MAWSYHFHRVFGGCLPRRFQKDSKSGEPPESGAKLEYVGVLRFKEMPSVLRVSGHRRVLRLLFPSNRTLDTNKGVWKTVKNV